MTRPTGRKKFKIHEDKVKTRHTSHWDWDYLSTEELDALVAERRAREAAGHAAAESTPATEPAGLIRGLLRRLGLAKDRKK